MSTTTDVVTDVLVEFPIVDAEAPGKAIVVGTATDTPAGAAPCYLVVEVVPEHGTRLAYERIVDRSYLPGGAIAKAIAHAGWANAVLPELVGDEELGRELAGMVDTTTGRAAAQPARRAIVARHVAAWEADDVAAAQEADRKLAEPTFAELRSSRHVEAHLLDAHGESIDPSIRPTLTELRRWHAEAHRDGRVRFPHHHADADLPDLDGAALDAGLLGR